MKKGILFTLGLVFIFTVQSQRYIWSPDSISLADPNYAMDRYHDILRYHDPIMYLAYPVIRPIIKRKLPLEDGEGKKGFWLQAHFGHRFVIYQGKYYSHPFLQRMRFTLDASLVSRITKDDSNPLLPFNNKFGFGLDFLFSRLGALKEEKAGLVWTTFQLHHYSNGQADTFFIDSVEEGIVPGGGVAYLRSLESLQTLKGSNVDENTGIAIIKRALEEPLRQIVQNTSTSIEGGIVVQKVNEGVADYGFNARTEKYENLLEAGVIDPTKVTRIAIENAASIAGLLLTTECVVAEKLKEQEAHTTSAPAMGEMDY